MNDKIELMKKAFDKIANDEDFIAFYLKKYSEFESKTQQDILAELNSSEEDFYKLALCKAPIPNHIQSHDILHSIGEYTHIDPQKINTILHHVRTIFHFQNLGNKAFLMAARTRNNK